MSSLPAPAPYFSRVTAPSSPVAIAICRGSTLQRSLNHARARARAHTPTHTHTHTSPRACPSLPPSLPLTRSLSLSLFRQDGGAGSAEEAAQHCNMALALEPDSAKAYFRRGLAMLSSRSCDMPLPAPPPSAAAAGSDGGGGGKGKGNRMEEALAAAKSFMAARSGGKPAEEEVCFGRGGAVCLGACDGSGTRCMLFHCARAHTRIRTCCSAAWGAVNFGPVWRGRLKALPVRICSC